MSTIDQNDVSVPCSPTAFSPTDHTADLIAAIQRLALARSVAEIQEIVRVAARRLSNADGATFVLRDGNCCYYADEDAVSPLWKGQRFPLEACISGWSMRHRQAVVIDDIYADARIPHDAYRRTFVKSLVMVPIRTIDPIGAIGNYWATYRVASAEEVKLLQALADSTAVAMENVRAYQELDEAHRETLQRLALAAEYRDNATYEHTVRVGRTASLLAQRIGLPDEEAALIGQAALLHDVGKLGISDTLLLKEGRLTPQEIEEMRKHTLFGGNILQGSTSRALALAREVALTHHEWWDGTGYPHGLAGEAIPIAGRIVAVTDVFDALTHVRSYKRAWSTAEAALEIKRLSGRQFDPLLVRAFETLLSEGLMQEDEERHVFLSSNVPVSY